MPAISLHSCTCTNKPIDNQTHAMPCRRRSHRCVASLSRRERGGMHDMPFESALQNVATASANITLQNVRSAQSPLLKLMTIYNARALTMQVPCTQGLLRQAVALPEQPLAPTPLPAVPAGHTHTRPAIVPGNNKRRHTNHECNRKVNAIFKISYKIVKAVEFRIVNTG